MSSFVQRRAATLEHARCEWHVPMLCQRRTSSGREASATRDLPSPSLASIPEVREGCAPKMLAPGMRETPPPAAFIEMRSSECSHCPLYTAGDAWYHLCCEYQCMYCVCMWPLPAHAHTHVHWPSCPPPAGQCKVSGVDRNPSSLSAKVANLEAAVTFLRETGVRLPDTALTGGWGSTSRNHCVVAPQYDVHPYHCRAPLHVGVLHVHPQCVCPSSLQT